jgi:hypothetical protein
MPRRWWIAPVSLYVPAVLLLGVAFLTSTRFGIPFDRLTSDAAIAYTDDAPFYSGYLSSFGMVLWSTAAGICCFAAFTLTPNTDERREARTFLATLGLLTAVLLVDDLFMIHEALYRLTGKSQKRVVLVQGLLLAWMLWSHRATISRSTNWPLLGSSLALFAGSLAVDFDAVALPARLHHLFEDGFKLAGVVGWWGYALACSARAVRLAADAPAERPLTASSPPARSTSPAAPRSPIRCTPSRQPVRAS